MLFETKLEKILPTINYFAIDFIEGKGLIKIETFAFIIREKAEAKKVPNDLPITRVFN